MEHQAKKKRRPKIGVYITKRDRKVMETLLHYGLLRESTLHQLCFPTVKAQRHVQGKLKRLVEYQYVGRRFLPIVHRDNREFIDYTHQARRDTVYFLGPKGAEFLNQPYDPRLAQVKLNYLHHRLDIADIRACLELALEKARGVTLSVWYNENDKDEEGHFILHDHVIIRDLETKRQRLSIRPDACFVLKDERTGKQDLFFLEVDEGTESGRKRWKDKIRGYRAYGQEGFDERYEFDGKGFRVLTINRSETGKEQGKRKANLVEVTHKTGGRKQFWFATFDQVMPEGRVIGDHILNSPIWKRVDKKKMEEELKLSDYLFNRNVTENSKR